MDFKSGDKVICVIPNQAKGMQAYEYLKLGKLYTVGMVEFDVLTICETNDWYAKLRFRLATELEKALS